MSQLCLGHLVHEQILSDRSIDLNTHFVVLLAVKILFEFLIGSKAIFADYLIGSFTYF